MCLDKVSPWSELLAKLVLNLKWQHKASNDELLFQFESAEINMQVGRHGPKGVKGQQGPKGWSAGSKGCKGRGLYVEW